MMNGSDHKPPLGFVLFFVAVFALIVLFPMVMYYLDRWYRYWALS